MLRVDVATSPKARPFTVALASMTLPALSVPRIVTLPAELIAMASFQMPVIGSLNPIAIPLAVMPMADRPGPGFGEVPL